MTAWRTEREAICRIGASLYQRGYVHARAGNLSLRLADGSLLITPTDACLGGLDPSRLAHVGGDGQQLSGDRASKTLHLHRRILDASGAPTRCVLHTHSHALVLLTLQGVHSPDAVMPPITPYFVMKVGRVPLVPYRLPGDPVVADWVAERIGRSRAAGRTLRAVLLERLGPVVWAEDPGAASAVLEELEETARLWARCQPASLEQAALDELAAQFGNCW